MCSIEIDLQFGALQEQRCGTRELDDDLQS